MAEWGDFVCSGHGLVGRWVWLDLPIPLNLEGAGAEALRWAAELGQKAGSPDFLAVES